MMNTHLGARNAWIILAGGCGLIVIAAAVGLLYLRSVTARPLEAAPIDAPSAQESSTTVPTDTPTAIGDCTISSRLTMDSVGPEVECLESMLASDGSFAGVPDTVFDSTTQAAVSSFQEANGLAVDGVAGPQTITALGVWVVPDPDPSTCAGDGRSAVIDRQFQRTWLCEDGSIVRTMPVTSSSAQPDPGSYRVTEKDMNATSEFSGDFTRMTHFVVFAEGKFSGARVGFHSVPTHDDGSFVQPLDSVGDLGLIGESSGCIRAVPDDATAIWDFLAVDDPVVVIS